MDDSGNEFLAELAKLRNQTKKPIEALILQILVETGITVSELVQLTPQNFTAKNLVIPQNVSRNKEKRTISITKTLKNKIQEYSKNNKINSKTPLLKTRQNTTMSPRRVQQILKQIATPRQIRKAYIGEQLKQNKTKEVKKKTGLKHLREKEYLTEKEITKVKEKAKGTSKLIVETIYETGCTVSELTQIKKQDLKESHLLVQGRKAKISPELKKQIQQKTNHILPLSTTRIRQILTELKKETGLKKLTPQLLRDTHIAHSLSKESNNDIEARLGIQLQRHAYGGLQHEK